MPEPQAETPICPLCERPHSMGHVFIGPFCSTVCKNFYEKATFVCHLCGSTVAHKYKDAHSRPCIKVRMDKLREEIRGKEGEIEGLAQELKEVEER